MITASDTGSRHKALSRKKLELLSRLYRHSADTSPLTGKLDRIAADAAELFACPVGDGNRSSCRILLDGISHGEGMHPSLLKSGTPIFVDEREAGSVECFCTGGCAQCPEIMELIQSSGIMALVAEHIAFLAMKEQQDRALEKARSFREQILNAAMDGFWMLDSKGCFTDVNDTYLTMSGYEREEFLCLSVSDIDADEDASAMEKRFRTLAEQGGGRFKTRHRRKDGSIFFVEVSVSLVRNETAGEEAADQSFVCFCRDISVQVAAQEQLEEKDLFLKEIYHRVKNDLSFIHSLLRLQESMQDVSENQQERALEDARNRIALVMQVYEALYEGSSVRAIQSDRLLDQIKWRLGNGNYGCPPTFDIETSPFAIPARMGIAVGTLINEMVINSLKYGLSADGRGCPIRIELKEELIGDGESERCLRILVRDQGPGHPREVLERNRTGFGLTVIKTLVRQYNGTMELANRPGAEISVLIKMQGS